jgi:hypothetical protein
LEEGEDRGPLLPIGNWQSAIGNHRNSFDNPPIACNLSVVGQLNVNSQFWFNGYFYPQGNSAF